MSLSFLSSSAGVFRIFLFSVDVVFLLCPSPTLTPLLLGCLWVIVGGPFQACTLVLQSTSGCCLTSACGLSAAPCAVTSFCPCPDDFICSFVHPPLWVLRLRVDCVLSWSLGWATLSDPYLSPTATDQPHPGVTANPAQQAAEPAAVPGEGSGRVQEFPAR